MQYVRGGGGGRGVARAGRDSERFSPSLSPAAGGFGGGGRVGQGVAASRGGQGRVGWCWVGGLSDCAGRDLAG